MRYILGLMLLTSCGYINREVQQITGRPSSVCHNSISYLQFASGVTVEYETVVFFEGTEPITNPTIKKCK